MSGLEVLGALAAASQLVEQGLKIALFLSELYKKVQDAPESIRKQAVQIEQLVDICRLIESNRSLQTAAVASILRTCLLEVGNLQDILRKISVAAHDGKAKQLWKAIDGATREKKINTLFGKIEQQKSSLTLCIQAIDSALLHKELPAIAVQLTTIMQHLTLVSKPLPSSSDSKVFVGHFMVPFTRNPSFIGRDAYLKDLAVRIELGDRHSRVALVGLGGVGKSQVAIEYAYQFHEKFPGASVFWVYASNASRFDQDYLQIGMLANLPGINDPNQDINQLVKSWLGSKESGKWLMVIDNADDSDLFFGPITKAAEPAGKRHLSDYVPQCSNGSILFTTRNRKVGIKLATVSGVASLGPMERDDSEELLRARSGDITLDKGSVTELLELLEDLPFAIIQAASYIAENSITVHEYLEMYNGSEASRTELLSENFEDLARDAETRNPVATTWMISFDQIRQVDPSAANLLSFMACLDRRGIPKDLLPPCGSVVELSRAIGLLKAYSLITATPIDTVFDMHRLVHLATRNWLRQNHEFDAWAKSCLTTLSAKYPARGDGYRLWSTCRLYLPHARAVLTYEQLSPANDNLRARLASSMFWYLFVRSRYTDGEPLATLALDWSMSAHGEQNLKTLNSMVDVAQCMHMQEKYKAAEELNRRALNIYVHLLGENWAEHKGALKCMNALSLSVRDQGRYDEAKELQLHTLEIAKRTLGEEHHATLTHMGNLAVTYHRQGSYGAAQELLLASLRIARRTLGEEHPNTLHTMANLAMSYNLFPNRQIGGGRKTTIGGVKLDDGGVRKRTPANPTEHERLSIYLSNPTEVE